MAKVECPRLERTERAVSRCIVQESVHRADVTEAPLQKGERLWQRRPSCDDGGSNSRARRKAPRGEETHPDSQSARRAPAEDLPVRTLTTLREESQPPGQRAAPLHQGLALTDLRGDGGRRTFLRAAAERNAAVPCAPGSPRCSSKQVTTAGPL